MAHMPFPFRPIQSVASFGERHWQVKPIRQDGETGLLATLDTADDNKDPA